MSKKAGRGGRPKEQLPPNAPPLALTIRQFCEVHNISEAFYFLLQSRGEGPRVMRLGSRVLIPLEEAARWRAERVAASQK
jgi:hypothetical protein